METHMNEGDVQLFFHIFDGLITVSKVGIWFSEKAKVII